MASSDSDRSTCSNGGSMQENLLECPMCHLPYDNADHEGKLLSCHHTCCLGCLEQLSEDRQLFRCPVCKKKMAVPKGGVDKLQTNFYLSQVREVVAPSKGTPETETCSKHMNQPLLFYCETCNAAICMNCTVLDHDKSAGHSIKDVAAAAKSHRGLLQSKLKKLDSAIQSREDGLNTLKQELGNLVIANDVALQHLNESFTQLKTKLVQRHAELISQLDRLYTEKREAIVNQAQTIKNETQKLKQVKERLEGIVNGSNPTTIVTTVNNANTMTRVDEMSEPTPLKSVKGYLEFQFDKGLEAFVQSVARFGEIKSEKSLPANIKFDVWPTVSSVTSAINLTVTSSSGKSLSNFPISATITDPCKDVVKNQLQSQGHGVYVIKFRPQMPGRHILNLYFLDKVIAGMEREFNVDSNNPVLKIGEEGSKAGQLFHPTSVAVSSTGNIYVADMGNKRVQIYDRDGEPLTQFKIGTSKSTTYDLKVNSATEELFCTRAAPDDSGIMVANNIRIFSLGGERKRQMIVREMRNALFMTINSKGWIILTDSAANVVCILSKEGQLAKKFGKQGSKPGEFNFPSAICTGKNDEIILSDTKNDRIQIFDKEGNYIREFGKEGGKKAQIRSPRGVAATNENILVADMSNMIKVFSYDGVFVSCIDSLGDKIDEPYNMAVTSDYHVLVADFKNNCIKKYKFL